MGALLARAQQLREQTPQWPARLCAQVSPQDLSLIHILPDDHRHACDDRRNQAHLELHHQGFGYAGGDLSLIHI